MHQVMHLAGSQQSSLSALQPSLAAHPSSPDTPRTQLSAPVLQTAISRPSAPHSRGHLSRIRPSRGMARLYALGHLVTHRPVELGSPRGRTGQSAPSFWKYCHVLRLAKSDLFADRLNGAQFGRSGARPAPNSEVKWPDFPHWFPARTK